MATERAPKPWPEGKYNPRLFMTMAHSPEYFRGQMPRLIAKVADMSDLMVSSAPVLDEMRMKMQGLLNDGSPTIMDVIYGDFATKHGWSVERRLFEGSAPISVPRPMQDLTEEQQRSWDAFRGTGEVPREVALVAFDRAIMRHFDQLPSVKYDVDTAAVELDTRLRQAPFQIAHKLFPDLRDEEARKLFGNRTAADIHRLAEEANQGDK
jgi:hypothetical protein